MKKVAIIISSCGVYDGSEIHEAVLTLLAASLTEALSGINSLVKNVLVLAK